MAKIIMFLFVPIFLFAQNTPIRELIFENVTNDTISSATSADSIYIQFGNAGGTWQQLTESLNDTAYVTNDDKDAGTVVQFTLSGESYWTYAPQVRFEIRSTGTDTITSRWINVSYLNGACLLTITPDTSGTTTDYGNSVLEGN